MLTEYRGLTVAQLKELRNAISEDATYAVVKNTLTKIAAKKAGVDRVDDELAGPSAIAFVTATRSRRRRVCVTSPRRNPLLVIKGGYFDGKPLTAAEVTKLADLESREVLLAKLAGAMKASLFSAAYLFAAPLSQAARSSTRCAEPSRSRADPQPDPGPAPP